MQRNNSTRLWLIAVCALALAAWALAQGQAAPVRRVIAGQGLAGGGDGPVVNISVADSGITSAMIRDETIEEIDLSPAAKASLRAQVSLTELTEVENLVDGRLQVVLHTFTLGRRSLVRLNSYEFMQLFQVRKMLMDVRLCVGNSTIAHDEVHTAHMDPNASGNPWDFTMEHTFVKMLEPGTYRFEVYLYAPSGGSIFPDAPKSHHLMEVMGQ